MATVLYTIGFTKKSLREFVEILKSANVDRLIDIRLSNTSQLAGFAKRDDLAFICETFDIDYMHVSMLAPTESMFKMHKETKDWNRLSSEFVNLLQQRGVEEMFDSLFAGKTACLLCSEPKPARCHRRLVAEYYQKHYPEIEINHL